MQIRNILPMTVLSGLALLPISAVADSLYKCIDSEGIPSYVSRELKGQKCTFVSNYQPVDNGRWKYLVSSSESAVSVDSQTIVAKGGVIEAWVQYSYFPDSAQYINGQRVERTVQREEFHCADMKVAVVSRTVYGKSGALDQFDAILSPIPRAIAPGTVAERVFSSLCRK